MFQVAGLLSIARETGSILLIPSTTTLRRAFDFETTFNDSIQFVGEDLSRQLAEDLNASKITLTVSLHFLRFPKIRHFQSCCAYRNLSTILFNDSRIIERIDGYFQNFRYFHPDSQKIVKKLFTFMDPVRKRVSFWNIIYWNIHPTNHRKKPEKSTVSIFSFVTFQLRVNF